MSEGINMLEGGDQAGAVERFRQAALEYERAVQADPDNLFWRTYLGLTYFYAGDAVKGRSLQLEVLNRDPNYLWAIFNLAWIQESSGRSSEALLLYQRYLDAAETEKANVLKYAEQYELIETQTAAAKESLARLQASGDE